MDEFRNRKEPYKPMVYICSPYSGDTQHNTEQAKSIADLPMNRERFL